MDDFKISLYSLSDILYICPVAVIGAEIKQRILWHSVCHPIYVADVSWAELNMFVG